MSKPDAARFPLASRLLFLGLAVAGPHAQLSPARTEDELQLELQAAGSSHAGAR